MMLASVCSIRDCIATRGGNNFLETISCVRDQDATIEPARHMSETGSLNWAQFMLQRFINFPEFTEFLFYLGKTLLFHFLPSVWKIFYASLCVCLPFGGPVEDPGDPKWAMLSTPRPVKMTAEGGHIDFIFLAPPLLARCTLYWRITLSLDLLLPNG